MGCKRNWLMIMYLCALTLWPPEVQSSENYTRASLNSFDYDYAIFKKTPRPRTGRLYNISLPSNFSGAEVSVLRLRTRSLWMKGANFSFFEIPPRTLPWPFTKRIDIVYQNLGNWSSFYYNVPNYTFVAPVLGFLAYDSNASSINNKLVKLERRGENPVIVRFPNITSLGNETWRCVRFENNGTFEFSNVTRGNSCVAKGQGHFSIVVPYHKKSKNKEEKKEKMRWWVMGIAAGVVGLVLLLVLGIFGFKMIKRYRMRKMERESERSEGLDTIWVGRSRMPSASGIRTQPVLETTYVP